VWIKDVPSESLQASIERLERSYQNFFRTFKKGSGFPKFASKHRYNSILFKRVKVLEDNFVQLPKIGKVKMFKDSEIKGTPKTATIIKEPTGFFICITCKDVEKNISNPDESQAIGLDMGVAHFCIDSNGNFYVNPRHFLKYERKLRIENRALARKVKGSNRWKKQKKKLARLHHTIANVRKDYLHKLSTELAIKYHTVFIEDLKISNMARNKNLSKHILDCGWGMFKVMLEYKTNVVKINPKYTSQECHECKTVDSKSRLSQSEFICKSCGHVDNADINAAKNIMSKGIALIR
jgi:putative transposase